MKQLIIIATLSLAVILSACDNGTSPQQKTSDSATVTLELKVINWGPQSTTVGLIPNIQPHGGMGVWIQASGTQEFGEAQVIFDGHPAIATGGDQNGITAEIDPKQLAKPGKKEVVIKQVATNKLFPVGVFDVQPAK